MGCSLISIIHLYMCYILSTEKVILNYFAKSKKERIKLSDLNEYSSKIVKSCKNGIIIQLSRDTIDDAINQRSDIFEFHNEEIVLIDRENVIIKNINLVNRTIPPYICTEIESISI